jgi:hypothetical protein
VFIVTACLLGIRAWRSINNNRNKYVAQQMQTLYYQNMNNNRGLIALLVDRSEDEEFKETMLAYVFLLSLHAPVRAQYLAKHIEVWLFDTFRVRVCFDIHDALDKVGLRFGVVAAHVHSSGTWDSSACLVMWCSLCCECPRPWRRCRTDVLVSFTTSPARHARSSEGGRAFVGYEFNGIRLSALDLSAGVCSLSVCKSEDSMVELVNLM